MKKVFFFDVDGTLLPAGNEKGVDEKTIYALNYLKDNGHDVVFATGKSEQMIADQLAATGINSHITMNGAQIVVDGEVKHVEQVGQSTLEQLKLIAKQNDLMIGCQTRFKYYMLDINFNPDLAEDVLSAVSLDVPEIFEDFNNDDVISQLWFLGDHSALDFTQPIVPGQKLLKWHNNGCDIVIDYVSKAFAIEKYLELVYPDTEVETYAFGDGNNDIEMFELVDNGIAMGNAVEPLKAVATHITDSCEDLGVYNYLLEKKFIEE